MPKIINIISAGMHRSGSTWLFNVLRTIYTYQNIEIHSCFLTRKPKSEFAKEVNIYKIHSFKSRVCNHADYIFLTKRDIRDIAASARRRNLVQLRDIIPYLSRVIKNEYEQWLPYVDMEIQYEEFLNKKPEYILKIANLLKQPIDEKDAEKIHYIVEEDAHLPDGGIYTFKKSLPEEIIAEIEGRFSQYCFSKDVM